MEDSACDCAAEEERQLVGRGANCQQTSLPLGMIPKAILVVQSAASDGCSNTFSLLAVCHLASDSITKIVFC